MQSFLVNQLMRLDKYLCECLGETRSGVKKIIGSGKVTVNGQAVKKADIQIDENSDNVEYLGKKLVYEKFVYYMLNKPEGIVSANNDDRFITVIDLFKKEGRKNLSCVGRLDKDTTGLLIVTDDGNLLHNLTSPKKKVIKEYLVDIAHSLTEEDIDSLEKGVDIGDDKPTAPATVNVVDEKTIILSITEGRFHEVKRMLQAVSNEVLSLKRLSMGGVRLDEELHPGEYRRLTAEELKCLKEA